jgi:hypothetical protein
MGRHPMGKVMGRDGKRSGTCRSRPERAEGEDYISVTRLEASVQRSFFSAPPTRRRLARSVDASRKRGKSATSVIETV